MSWQHEASANALFRAWEATVCYFFWMGIAGEGRLVQWRGEKVGISNTFGDVSGDLLHQDEVF